MQDQAISPCQCLNCPGASCICGCQAITAPTAQLQAASPHCGCAGGCGCGCDAAEQGCLCN